MTTCLAALIHVRLTNANHITNSLLRNGTAHLFSGFMYGILALNTKLTNLALLPFLFAYSAVQCVRKKSFSKQKLAIEVCYQLLIVFVCFFVGASCGYGPWMLLYYNETGRWLPNAWPSQKMIEKSVWEIRLGLSFPEMNHSVLDFLFQKWTIWARANPQPL